LDSPPILFTPILLRFTLYRWRRWVLALDLAPAAGAVARVLALRHDAFATEQTGVLEHRRPSCSNTASSTRPERDLRTSRANACRYVTALPKHREMPQAWQRACKLILNRTSAEAIKRQLSLALFTDAKLDLRRSAYTNAPVPARPAGGAVSAQNAGNARTPPWF
jgi:hypothetical protein